MRTLQNYRDIYREISDNLGLQGDSVEMLIQLLAQASYISEVENIAYAQESSLEKATLINSKIQHCMNDMYSVFRGSCPRVILNFRPTKYFSFNIFDKIISSNTFSVYYLGYYNGTQETNGEDYASRVAIEEGFVYGPTTIPPALGDETYTIIGLLCKETKEESWVLDKNNTFYVDCLEENLSNDMWVKINDKYIASTRLFSDHILNAEVFDLTIPSFGSRLYVADIFRNSLSRDIVTVSSNVKIDAFYYVFSKLSDYNESELKKINIKGGENKSFDSEFLTSRSYEELAPGIIVIEERPRDTVDTVHYRANRDRFVNSILRSNSDIGTVLEEAYPDKVLSSGTNYKFNSMDGDSNTLDIYYIPSNPSNLLTSAEIEKFIETKKAYYITDTINIYKGYRYTAVFNIVLELYQSIDVNQEVADILKTYENKFNLVFNSTTQEEIKSLISKISNIKQVRSFSVNYIKEDGQSATEEEVTKNSWKTYFKINYVISSTIQSKVV